jgi:hypothetical protein
MGSLLEKSDRYPRFLAFGSIPSSGVRPSGTVSSKGPIKPTSHQRRAAHRQRRTFSYTSPRTICLLPLDVLFLLCRVGTRHRIDGAAGTWRQGIRRRRQSNRRTTSTKTSRLAIGRVLGT